MTAPPSGAALAAAREALEHELEKWDEDKSRGFVSGAFLVRPDHARTILAALKRAEASAAEQARSQEAATASAVAAARAEERDNVRIVLRAVHHGGGRAGGGDPYHPIECELCAIVDCPHAEPLHYHHDGCPACETEDK